MALPPLSFLGYHPFQGTAMRKTAARRKQRVWAGRSNHLRLAAIVRLLLQLLFWIPALVEARLQCGRVACVWLSLVLSSRSIRTSGLRLPVLRFVAGRFQSRGCRR